MTQEVLNQCLDIVKNVAEFQLKYFRAMPEDEDVMKNPNEMVSFVDVKSERMLKEELMPIVEDAGFYGEESGKTGSQELVWIVDPIDGTTNYLNGIEQFSISVALVQNGEPILGIVHRPVGGETYSSLKGHGVFLNGKKVSIADINRPASEALFGTGFPYRSEDLQEAFFKTAPEVLQLGRGIRRMASAALDVCYLSTGFFQGFWESDLQAYDVAAGILFMKENGVIITNHHGEPYNMFTDRVMVAALPNVHGDLLEIVRKNYAPVVE